MPLPASTSSSQNDHADTPAGSDEDLDCYESISDFESDEEDFVNKENGEIQASQDVPAPVQRENAFSTEWQGPPPSISIRAFPRQAFHSGDAANRTSTPKAPTVTAYRLN